MTYLPCVEIVANVLHTVSSTDSRLNITEKNTVTSPEPFTDDPFTSK